MKKRLFTVMDLDGRERYEPVMFMYNPDIYLKRQRGIFVSKSTGKKGFLLTAYRSAGTDNADAAGLSLVYECGAASQWIVHGRYQATILSVRIHAEENECMHGTEMGELASFREPSREETMPTYAFCVLQTFHRLCKTSESVRPLKLWEGGGRRRGQVN